MGSETMGVKIVPVISCACCGSVTVFVAVAVFMSLKSLEQGRFALKLNWGTQQIHETVEKDPGMKFVGLGNELIEFPSTFQSLVFGGAGSGEDTVRGPLRARTMDGLEIFVHVTFQWQLESSTLHELYEILGGGNHNLYNDEFVRFARASLVESCAMFEADLFFTNRTEIQNDMHARMRLAFDKPEKGLKVMIQNLQLKEFSLPAAFDQEIKNTEKQKQMIKEAIAQRTVEEVGLQKEIAVAREDVEQW